MGANPMQNTGRLRPPETINKGGHTARESATRMRPVDSLEGWQVQTLHAVQTGQEEEHMNYAPTICQQHGCPDFAIHNGRCSAHARQRQAHLKKTVPTNIDGNRWYQRKRRANAVRRWRNQYGDWCPGYKVPAHHATDLTAEHSQALAEGGDQGQALTVLCRSCNSRHGAETKNLYN